MSARNGQYLLNSRRESFTPLTVDASSTCLTQDSPAPQLRNLPLAGLSDSEADADRRTGVFETASLTSLFLRSMIIQARFRYVDAQPPLQPDQWAAAAPTLGVGPLNRRDQPAPGRRRLNLRKEASQSHLPPLAGVIALGRTLLHRGTSCAQAPRPPVPVGTRHAHISRPPVKK